MLATAGVYFPLTATDDTHYYNGDETRGITMLEADAVVVDEMSMVDVPLFASLLRAMKTGCRLIMVGDTDQLPAVGAGSVLHDLIDSGVLPTVKLTQVFRQALTSDIVANAHRIVSGDMPKLGKKDGDFFFLEQFFKCFG